MFPFIGEDEFRELDLPNGALLAIGVSPLVGVAIAVGAHICMWLS